MLRSALVAIVLLVAPSPLFAAPSATVFDDDLAFRAAGYESLASTLVPISRGLSGGYAIGFGFDPATGAGGFVEGGSAVGLPAVQAGSAIGFRLVTATFGEATHSVNAIPAATTLSGAVDPLAIVLLVPAVQTVRDAPTSPGDGPTCEPPPEPVCQEPANAPPGSGPFEPVDWLVIEFGDTLLDLTLQGSFDFRPEGPGFGPDDMAVEIHYLRQVAVAEPSTVALLLIGVAGAAWRRWQDGAG